LFRKPAINIHKKKWTNESKGKPKQKFDAAFGKRLLELVSVFKEASKNFTEFSLEMSRLKIFKNQLRMSRKY
jgi:hypothetical protein